MQSVHDYLFPWSECALRTDVGQPDYRAESTNKGGTVPVSWFALESAGTTIRRFGSSNA